MTLEDELNVYVRRAQETSAAEATESLYHENPELFDAILEETDGEYSQAKDTRDHVRMYLEDLLQQ